MSLISFQNNEQNLIVANVAQGAALMGDQSNKVSSTVENTSRLSWNMDDTVSMLRLIQKHGKNWEYILLILQTQQHRLTEIKDPVKLKNHYASLTSKKTKIREPYIIPQFKISSAERKRVSNEEITRKEHEFAAHHAFQKALKEEATTILEIIENTEILDSSSNDVINEKELRNELKRKGEERKQARQQKVQKSMELAEKDLKIKSELQELILQVKKAIGAIGKKRCSNRSLFPIKTWRRGTITEIFG